jgi:transposase
MKTALAVLGELPNNKAQIKTFVSSVKNEILSNTKNTLPILVQLKMVEKTLEEILKDEEIDLKFLNEFLLYDKSEAVKVNGAELRQSEVGTKYDYVATGDKTWIDLDRQIQGLIEKRKEREKFLQSIPYDAGVVDAETGLFLTRPPKSSHTKVIVKL